MNSGSVGQPTVFVLDNGIRQGLQWQATLRALQGNGFLAEVGTVPLMPAHKYHSLCLVGGVEISGYLNVEVGSSETVNQSALSCLEKFFMEHKRIIAPCMSIAVALVSISAHCNPKFLFDREDREGLWIYRRLNLVTTSRPLIGKGEAFVQDIVSALLMIP